MLTFYIIQTRNTTVRYSHICLYFLCLSQIGLSTPDDITFDLEDLKFYDHEENVMNHKEAFRSQRSDTECDISSTRPPTNTTQPVTPIKWLGAASLEDDENTTNKTRISLVTVVAAVILLCLLTP